MNNDINSFLNHILKENKFKTIGCFGFDTILYDISDSIDKLFLYSTQEELNILMSKGVLSKDIHISVNLFDAQCLDNSSFVICEDKNINCVIIKYNIDIINKLLKDNNNILQPLIIMGCLKKDIIRLFQDKNIRIYENEFITGQKLCIVYRNDLYIPSVANNDGNQISHIHIQNKYAIFVCVTNNYLSYLNVLLNSIHKYCLPVDVYIIYHELNIDYLRTIQYKFNFTIFPIKINKEQILQGKIQDVNNNLFIKQARFYYLNYAYNYDSVALFDADMYITSDEIMNLFECVTGTPKLIGCNEKIKWIFDSKYRKGKNKEIIFDEPIQSFKFHCSVPIIFDIHYWQDVIDYYISLAYKSCEVDKNNNSIKPIGDIFCWNMSVYKMKKEKNIVLFPMETMTQVHHHYFLPEKSLYKVNTQWYTEVGDLVYAIHGRIGSPGWYDGQMRGAQKLECKYTGIVLKAQKILKSIQKEWYDLNTNSAVNIYDFVPDNEYWNSFK